MKTRHLEKSHWGILRSSMLLLAISSAWAQNPISSSGQASVVNPDSRESSQAERRIETITTCPMQWYRDAAAQGSLEAVFILGWLYQHGQGVHRDYRQAAVYYQAAADRGHAVAENNLG